MSPDLELRITAQGAYLAFELTSSVPLVPYYRTRVGTTNLVHTPGVYVERLFEQLSTLARQDGASTTQQTMTTLAGIGQRLYRELLPSELKHAYGAIRGVQQDSPLSLMIISDEPWIPWELIKPYEDVGDGSPIIDDAFWAESFALTRWLAGTMAPRELIVAQVAVVAPALDLDHASQEQAYFERLLQERQIAALRAVAHYAEVHAALRSGAIQLYHVATHGGFQRERPDEAAIELEDGVLRASAIIGPVQSGIRQARPLVFLNASHTGRQDVALTGLGGWTQEFVKAGASAFVGAQWEAHDQLASQFATTFYDALRAGVPLGLAAHQARMIIKELAPADPTWLAYAIYGDPDLRVTFTAASASITADPLPDPSPTAVPPVRHDPSYSHESHLTRHDPVGLHANPLRVPPTIEMLRYPELAYQPEVLLRQRTIITVQILRQATHPEDRPITIADIHEKEPQIEVVLRAPGFTIVGENIQSITVARNEDSYTYFDLIAQEIGTSRIDIDFYQNNRRLGGATGQIVVRADTPAVPPPPVSKPVMIALNPAIPPDLDLLIRWDAQSNTLDVELTSHISDLNYHHRPMGIQHLEHSPRATMEKIYQSLSKLSRSLETGIDESKDSVAEIARYGRRLFDILPAAAQASLWELSKDQRVNTLQITSDEPWLPWELVKPYQHDSRTGSLIEQPYLCERFAIARWLRDNAPATSIKLDHLRLAHAADQDLEWAEQELTLLKNLAKELKFTSAPSPLTARRDVIDMFQTENFDLLHIACHGGFNKEDPDESGIMLDSLLKPSHLQDARFIGQRQRPLVFINACHSARQDIGSLCGMGGWARQLIGTRVGAYIGTAWEVHDELAYLFATTFYNSMLKKGMSLGESVRQARLAVRDRAPGNPSWLAYVLYADPTAIVSSPFYLRDIILSPKQRIDLAKLILECPTMQSPGGRAQVIGALKPAIRNAAPNNGAALMEMVGLLKICENHRHGIQDLVEELRNYEDGSIPMQAIDDFLAEC
jgi:CHAT domain-containing protein